MCARTGVCVFVTPSPPFPATPQVMHGQQDLLEALRRNHGIAIQPLVDTAQLAAAHFADDGDAVDGGGGGQRPLPALLREFGVQQLPRGNPGAGRQGWLKPGGFEVLSRNFDGRVADLAASASMISGSSRGARLEGAG